jgi:predicted dehydrogenase
MRTGARRRSGLSDTAMKIGIIGCGRISTAYLECVGLFPTLEMVRCADLLPERAVARAAEFGVPRSGTVEELLADADIELVINLTVPAVHAEVNRASLLAGKHVFCEKPFAINRASGAQLVELARGKGLRIGCAPDTFLGEAHQTCRALIDRGEIGEVLSATAFFAGHGPEDWHPNPVFFYQPGGGPMFDMGPYYLTALVNMLGPMERVTGFTSRGFQKRFAAVLGTEINVTIPTHLTGAIQFGSGAVATVIMSFDVWKHNLPMLQVHGTKGSLDVPDPNTTFGNPRIYRPETKAWEDVPLAYPTIYGEKYGRGAGVADMAEAILTGRPHRASGEMALHVVDGMVAFLESGSEGRAIELTTTCERPARL